MCGLPISGARNLTMDCLSSIYSVHLSQYWKRFWNSGLYFKRREKGSCSVTQVGVQWRNFSLLQTLPLGSSDLSTLAPQLARITGTHHHAHSWPTIIHILPHLSNYFLVLFLMILFPLHLVLKNNYDISIYTDVYILTFLFNI